MGNYYGNAKKEPKYHTNIEEKAKDEIDKFFKIYFTKTNKEEKDDNISINDLLKYMKVFENQLYFTVQLSQARAVKKNIPKDVFNYLEQIFSLIVKLLNENNNRKENFRILQYILILSDTFFYENTKKEKIYLKENLLKKNFSKY